jgi:hypothetical protein
MSVIICGLVGCATPAGNAEPWAQLEASKLPVSEQQQILTAVFSEIVSRLHANDQPAYLSIGREKQLDPAPAVVEALQFQHLRAYPRSARPATVKGDDGMPGTSVYVYAFIREGPEQVRVDVGVMATILAGSGYRLTLVKKGDDWWVARKESTWIS